MPLEEHAGLLTLRAQAVHLGGPPDRIQVRVEALAHLRPRILHQLGGQIGVRRHHHERDSVQRVGARRVHRHGLGAPLDGELHVRSRGAPDPVALHAEHLGRPGALQLVQVVQQPVPVVGDPEIPLGQLLLGDEVVAALAPPVDDLLVRQNGLVERAPVDLARLAVSEPALVELQEQPLVPAVVLRVARLQHPVPVEARRVAAHARLLLGDVVVGPPVRVEAALDRGVLGGEPERVPADRVEHAEALLTPVACDDIAERIRFGVTHVQIPRRIREHVQDVLPRPLVVGVVGGERLELVPDRKPLVLDGREVVLRAVDRGFR